MYLTHIRSVVSRSRTTEFRRPLTCRSPPVPPFLSNASHLHISAHQPSPPLPMSCPTTILTPGQPTEIPGVWRALLLRKLVRQDTCHVSHDAPMPVTLEVCDLLVTRGFCASACLPPCWPQTSSDTVDGVSIFLNCSLQESANNRAFVVDMYP